MDRETKIALARELYTALEDLDASPDLLSIVGSLGDTLSDADVVRLLASYNRNGTMFARVICGPQDN